MFRIIATKFGRSFVEVPNTEYIIASRLEHDFFSGPDPEVSFHVCFASATRGGERDSKRVVILEYV